MNRERLYFRLVVLVFIASVVGWIFWIPYDPASLYRAIPANAMVVSSNDQLAGRWEALSTNVLLKSLVSRLTAAQGEYTGLIGSPARPPAAMQQLRAGSVAGGLAGRQADEARKWMARLGSRETVISYVPSLGKSGEPAWIAASWIGNTSLYLRWLFFAGQIPQFKKLGNHAGRPMWELDEPVTESGMKLSIAMGEGVLLACVSRQPDGIRHVLTAYEGLAPSVFSTKQFHNMPASGASDKGWIRLPPIGGLSHDPVIMSYQIPGIGPDGLAGDLHILTGAPACAPLCEILDLPGQLLGDLPAIIAVLPLSVARDLLSGPSLPAWTKVASDLLKPKYLPADPNCLILSVLTGDYSGGFGKEPLRMRVPTILAMVKVKSSDIATLISEALDSLNAQYRLGLIADPSPVMAGNRCLTTIETTSDNPLSSLEAEDRPAYALFGEWLILCSNAQTLAKLLERVQDPETNFNKGDWQKRLEDKRAAALIWLNLESGGKALQLPLALWSLNLRARPGASASPALARLTCARSWLEDARPLRTCAIWMDPGTSQPVIHVEIGRP